MVGCRQHGEKVGACNFKLAPLWSGGLEQVVLHLEEGGLAERSEVPFFTHQLNWLLKYSEDCSRSWWPQTAALAVRPSITTAVTSGLQWYGQLLLPASRAATFAGSESEWPPHHRSTLDSSVLRCWNGPFYRQEGPRRGRRSTFNTQAPEQNLTVHRVRSL